MAFLFSWRGSSLPVMLNPSLASSVDLTPRTMSILISMAFGMLLSDRWMACSVLLLAKGHWIACTLLLRFIPDKLITINLEELLIMLTRYLRKLRVRKSLRKSRCWGSWLSLRLRYYICWQFSLITYMMSENWWPWMLMLLRLSSLMCGIATIIFLSDSMRTNSSKATWLNRSLMSRFVQWDRAIRS